MLIFRRPCLHVLTAETVELKKRHLFESELSTLAAGWENSRSMLSNSRFW